VPHQEINASPDETCEAVVVREGQDPIVVNLDLRTPEPASAGHGGMPFHPDTGIWPPIPGLPGRQGKS
jgi:hypothetical protein